MHLVPDAGTDDKMSSVWLMVKKFSGKSINEHSDLYPLFWGIPGVIQEPQSKPL